MLLRTTIERNSIIPILKITKTCIANPSLTNSIKQSALLSEITKTIELAERFGGRLLNSEEYPNLEKIEIDCDLPTFDVFLLYRPTLLSTTTQEFIRFINRMKL